MSRFVIAVAVLEISCRKQTDKQTPLQTLTATVGVRNYKY